MSSKAPGEAGLTPPAGTFARGDLPTHIGPYRVLASLGEGGMGVVYLAEQTEPVHREVAIKVVRDVDSGGVMARFQTERQALAVMEHPGITKVFDAGTTASGWPYFVMERVHGTSITEYADSHRLDLGARLRLFVQICQAVQHAHQKGIIHRDIKPSNVLVTDAGGEPLCKVIDFGIAKAIEPGPEAQHLTATGVAIGTPAYMSPEQGLGSGLDIDTRTDIYSLGVLLYELLAGAAPYESQSLRSWAVIAHHAWSDAPAPSSRYAALPPLEQQRIADDRATTPVVLRRDLRGDLDAIVLKALEKEREQRYASAAVFASDIEHYLANEPVLASSASGMYRARKFARRHRVGVAFTSTIAAILVAFAVAATIQAQRLARAQRIAVARQAQAEELIGFMVGDLRTGLSKIGRLDVLDDVAKKALEYFAAVPEHELSDAELFRRSVALRQLGEVRMERNQPGPAMEVFEQSLRLAQGLAHRDSTVGEWQVGLGASHFWVGYVQYTKGEYANALAHFNAYLAITDSLVAHHPDSLSYRLELAEATSNIGSTREAQGDLRGALAAYERTIAIKRDLVRRDSSHLDWMLELAHSYNNVAVLQRRVGQLDSAELNHRAELALQQTLVTRDTGDMNNVRYLANAQAFLGDLLVARGREDEALVQLRASLANYQRLVARDSTNASRRRNMVNAERMIGQALLERGDAAGADRVLSVSIDGLRALEAAGAPTRAQTQMLAHALLSRAEARTRLGRTADAQRDAELGLAAARRMFDERQDLEGRRTLAEGYITEGIALASAGRAQQARSAWTSASQTIDSAAVASGQTEPLAVAAMARLQLDDAARATPMVRELVRRGYARRSLLALARSKEVPTAP